MPVPDRRARTRGKGEGASVLILLPAVALVLLVLGAIAVDASIAYLGRRQLAEFTAEAADRAAAGGIDKSAFYGTGDVRIDPALAEQIVATAEATASHSGLQITSVSVTVSPSGRSVTVAAAGTARAVFGVAVGGRRVFTVHAATTTDVAQVGLGP